MFKEMALMIKFKLKDNNRLISGWKGKYNFKEKGVLANKRMSASKVMMPCAMTLAQAAPST